MDLKAVKTNFKVLLLLISVISFFPSVRSDGSDISVSFSSVDFGLVKPGTEGYFVIPIRNLGKETVAVNVTFINIGNPGYTYLTALPSQITIPPDSQRNVTLLVKLPEDIKPGKYSANIQFGVIEETTGGLVHIKTSKETYVSFWIGGYRIEVFADDAEVGMESLRVFVYFGNYYMDKNVTARCELLVSNAETQELLGTFEGETRFFRNSGGTNYWLFVQNTTNNPSGDYNAKATVYVEEANETKTVEAGAIFTLGSRKGKLTDPEEGLTIISGLVEAGQTIQWYVSLENYGTLPLNVTIQTRAVDEYGEILYVKNLELIILQGETQTFNFTFQTKTQGFPTNLNELLFVLLGKKNVRIEMRIIYGYEETTRTQNVVVTAPVNIRIMVFTLLALGILGAVIVGIKARTFIRRRKTSKPLKNSKKDTLNRKRKRGSSR